MPEPTTRLPRMRLGFSAKKKEAPMPPEPTTCPECECPGYDLCHVGTQSPAADRVAALDADSRSLLRDLEALEAENRWIPVTEMMPPGGWTPRVLFAWRNTHGKRVSAGSWIKARTVEASGDLLEEDCDYDEDIPRHPEEGGPDAP